MLLFNGRKLYRQDELGGIDGGQGGTLDEQQLSFLEELLDESPELGNGTADSEAENELAAANKDDQGESADIPDNEPSATEEESDAADEQDPYLATIESLRAQVLALTEQVSVDPLRQNVQQDVQAAADQGEQSTTQQALEQFLSTDELDRLLDEPALINVAFNRAIQAMQVTTQRSVAQEVQRQIMISKAVTDFYSTNSDLLPYAKFVQFVMAEQEVLHKDKPYIEIFQTTASECRKRLGLSTPGAVTRDTNKGSQRPAFAGSKRGNSRPATKGEFFDPNAADMF